MTTPNERASRRAARVRAVLTRCHAFSVTVEPWPPTDGHATGCGTVPDGRTAREHRPPARGRRRAARRRTGGHRGVSNWPRKEAVGPVGSTLTSRGSAAVRRVTPVGDWIGPCHRLSRLTEAARIGHVAAQVGALLSAGGPYSLKSVDCNPGRQAVLGQLSWPVPPPAQVPGRLPHHWEQGAAARNRRPAAVGNLDSDDAVPSPDRDRDCLPGSTRAAVPKAIAEEFSPARQRHPRTAAQGRVPRLRTRGRPAPALPARQASRSPGPPAQPSAHRPSRPSSTREITRAAGRTPGCTPDSAAHVKPGHAASGPSVAVRGKPTVTPTVLAGRRPLCVRAPRASRAVRATDKGANGHGRNRWQWLCGPFARLLGR